MPSISETWPNDVNIANDSRVLMHENFEAYTVGINGNDGDTINNVYKERTSSFYLKTRQGINPTGNDVRGDKPFGTWGPDGHVTISSIVNDPAGERGKAWKVTIPANKSGSQDTLEVTTPLTSPMNGPITPTDKGGKPIHIRWYQKWDGGYYVGGSNHNAGELSGGINPGDPGHLPPASGSGWWTFVADCNYSPHANEVDPMKGFSPQEIANAPGWQHTYAYYAGHAAHKWFHDGHVIFSGGTPPLPNREFASNGVTNSTYYPDFVPRSCWPISTRNEWHCYELGVQCNDLPTSYLADGTGNFHNGTVSVWIDGVLRAVWTNLYFAGYRHPTQQFESDGTTPYLYHNAPLLCSEFRIVHGQNQAENHTNIKYYTDIVVATDYIGPMAGTAVPFPPEWISPLSLSLTEGNSVPPGTVLAANGNPVPAITRSGTLPAGITFQPTGSGSIPISGTPAAGSSSGGTPAGTYSQSVVATNNQGSIDDNYIITVTAQPTSNTAPTCFISSPANLATFPSPADITVTASATDIDINSNPNNHVANVKFYLNNVLQTTVNYQVNDIYTTTFFDVAPGPYSIKAVATDNQVPALLSTATLANGGIINVTVTSPPTLTPPTISVSA